MTVFRLQIQGEVRGGGQQSGLYRGMIKTAVGIAREEVSQSSLASVLTCMILSLLHVVTVNLVQTLGHLFLF